MLHSLVHSGAKLPTRWIGGKGGKQWQSWSGIVVDELIELAELTAQSGDFCLALYADAGLEQMFRCGGIRRFVLCLVLLLTRCFD